MLFSFYPPRLPGKELRQTAITTPIIAYVPGTKFTWVFFLCGWDHFLILKRPKRQWMT
jgi:hypothetical protein